MAISNQSVLKKMSSEIQEAMLQHGDEQKVREHIRSVRLLADLFLEQGQEETVSSNKGSQTMHEPTVDEIRKMMGADKTPDSKPKSEEKRLEDDDANGSSIFDF
ncbi:YwdI family protein [Halobacillus sp. K22]|uniref:YwdI family protein n=1 Tax=Halobacillus sp. K22 TaxID=3457431 RepID=UPI003FCEE590